MIKFEYKSRLIPNDSILNDLAKEGWELIMVTSYEARDYGYFKRELKTKSSRYLIWSVQKDMWWKPNHGGYTPFRFEAGEYSFEDANRIVNNANICLNDVPDETMIEFINMNSVLMKAKEITESDDYDDRTKHLK